MLEKLFKYSSKILVTILLAFLVMSFALWGIGDVIRGRSSTAVAKVGDIEIQDSEFRELLAQETEKIKASFGQMVTPEILASFQIEKRVINQIINEKLLTLAVADMEVIVGDNPALKEIASVPQFRAPDGSFDSAAFRNFLNNQRISEASFIGRLRANLARNVAIDSMVANAVVPEFITEQVYKYDNEKRRADVLEIPANYVSEVREPQESELIEFYEKSKANFAAPEYRSFSYVILDRDNVKAESSVGEDDLKRAYEEHIAEYTAPEQRDVQNILFADKEGADKAATAIKSGKDFVEAGKEFAGLEAGEINLGFVTKDALLEEISSKAFNMKQGEVSDPIESSLGWHLVKVKAIEQGKSKPFASVKEKIRQELQESNADEVIYSASTALEDGLAGGSTLEEVAGNLGLKVRKVEFINADGQYKATGTAPENFKYSNILSTAFSTDEANDSGLVRTPDSKGYFLVKVNEIVQARTKALDEVKGRVVQEWKRQMRKDVASSLATLASKKLNEQQTMNLETVRSEISKGNDLSKQMQAQFSGEIKIKKPEAQPRYTNNEGELPAAMVVELFSLKKGASTGYHEDREGNFLVGKLTEITPAPAPSAAKLSEIRDALKYSFADDVWEQYLAYLRLKYPVKIFEDKITTKQQ